jgi:hypothetical protein
MIDGCTDVSVSGSAVAISLVEFVEIHSSTNDYYRPPRLLLTVISGGSSLLSDSASLRALTEPTSMTSIIVIDCIRGAPLRTDRVTKLASMTNIIDIVHDFPSEWNSRN